MNLVGLPKTVQAGEDLLAAEVTFNLAGAATSDWERRDSNADILFHDADNQ